MAKQIAGLCFFEGTIDDITFYKMDGHYYARAKSSLSSKRVQTSVEFRKTMAHAALLVRASRIGSQIYKALPPGWRQFWMYRSFTGEAFTLLMENAYNDEEIKKFLWQCYVEYWEQRKVVDPDNSIWQPKPKKVRKRRKYSDESIQRLLKRKGKDGKPKWRDLEEEERKRQHKAINEACYKRTAEKEEKLRAASVEPRALELEREVPALLQPSLLRRAKDPGIEARCRDNPVSGMYITVNGILRAVKGIDKVVVVIEDS
jgi:hypothetical protein